VAASALAAWRPPMRLKNMHAPQAKINNNKKYAHKAKRSVCPRLHPPVQGGRAGGGPRSACMVVVGAAAAANWGSPKGDRLAAQPH